MINIGLVAFLRTTFDKIMGMLMPHKQLNKANFFLIYGLLLLFTACTMNNNNNVQESFLIVEELVENPDPLIRLYQANLVTGELKLLLEFDAQNSYWLSPNSQYVAMFSTSNDEDWSERNLTIIELDSGETIGHISGVGYIYPTEIHMHLGSDSVLWSPLNDKILLEKNATDGMGNALWVYDLKTNTETPLTSGEKLKYSPAWSNNGEYIAFVSTECVQNNDHCNQLDIVWDIFIANVETQTVQMLANFPNNSVFLESGTGDAFFCNLLWSPNDQYIAFENECLNSGSILESHRVFSVNVENGIVEEAVKFEQPYAYAYSYDWLDGHNLLIGFSRADYLNFQSYFKGAIKSYDSQKGSQTESVELLGFRGSEIKWNPDNATFIAFTTEPFFDLSENGQLSVSGSTLLGNYLDGDLTIFPESYNLPYGLCGNHTAKWSPDGQYFAFSSSGEPYNCREDVNATNVYVYSSENKQSINLTDSLNGIVTPAGWLTIQN